MTLTTRCLLSAARPACHASAALLVALTLGGCASMTKNCPDDPRAEAPWWCAVSGVRGGDYERETERAGEESAETERRLAEEQSRVDADKARLDRTQAESAALASELNGLNAQVRTTELRLEELREESSRSESELAALEARLEEIGEEIESLRARPSSGGGGSDEIALARERRAELEAELEGIIETLGE